MRLVAALLVALLAMAPAVAWSHSGGTDSDGCHVDSSTGIRHCHSSGGSSTVDSEPLTLTETGLIAAAVTLTGGIFTGLAIYMDDVQTSRILGAAFSLAAVIGSQIVVHVVGDAAEEEYGDDPVGLQIGFGVVNGLVAILDVLVIAGVTALRHEDGEAGLLHIDGDGLALGVPSLAVSLEGIAAGDLLVVRW